jgi:probable F420-dependent oxidoreductase
MKFSYFLPNMTEGWFTPVEAVNLGSMLERTRTAERFGYDGIWVGEFIETQGQQRAQGTGDAPRNYAPLATMTAVALATQRVRITSGVVLLPYHDPLILGREIATIDAFSSGRVTLGVGIGPPSREEFRRTRQHLAGVNRARLMEECLRAMVTLWTEPRATFQGEYFGFSELEYYPKPVQNPLPIYISGQVDDVLRRIARMGHGWIEFALNPERLREHIDRLHQYQDVAGRDHETIEVCRMFFMSIGETHEEAQEYCYRATGIKQPGAVTPSPEGFERYFVGSVDYICDRLRSYVAAGVTEINLAFYEPDLDAALRQLDLFATRVIPEIR